MVNYTNKYDLPPALFQALTRDTYVKVGDRSASELAGPIQKAVLEGRHDSEITIDAADNFWLLLGTALHHYLAEFDTEDAIKEESLSVTLGGHVVSGTSDLYFGDIDDYKVTKAWVSLYGVKPEWIFQLNAYAYLWHKHGFEVGDLRVMAILRDWDKNRAKQSKDYPRIPFLRMDIPKMPMDEIETRMINRLDAFAVAQDLPDHQLPACSDEERWRKQTTYAVMKEGRKTAVRVKDTYLECTDYMDEKKLMDGKHSIVKRPGAFTRCDGYCNAAPFCHQLVREKEGV